MTGNEPKALLHVYYCWVISPTQFSILTFFSQERQERRNITEPPHHQWNSPDASNTWCSCVVLGLEPKAVCMLRNVLYWMNLLLAPLMILEPGSCVEWLWKSSHAIIYRWSMLFTSTLYQVELEWKEGIWVFKKNVKAKQNTTKQKTLAWAG